MLQWEGRDAGKDRAMGESPHPRSDADEAVHVGVDASSRLSLDDAFDILRNQRRRYVLQYVLDSDSGSIELGEVAEHIAALENGKDTSEVTSNERKRAYIALYQNHLPRMDAVDVIEFESDRKQIRPGKHTRKLDRYLQFDPDGRPGTTEGRWPLYYLLVAVCGGLAVIASFLLGGFLARGRILLFAGTIAGFLVLPLVQLSQQHT